MKIIGYFTNFPDHSFSLPLFSTIWHNLYLYKSIFLCFQMPFFLSSCHTFKKTVQELKNYFISQWKFRSIRYIFASKILNVFEIKTPTTVQMFQFQKKQMFSFDFHLISGLKSSLKNKWINKNNNENKGKKLEIMFSKICYF